MKIISTKTGEIKEVHYVLKVVNGKAKFVLSDDPLPTIEEY